MSAAHIPGSSNVEADRLSRNPNLNLEWMLSRPIFQRIVSLFGRPDIDLFASRLNAQVETYVSWRPQPMAKFVDAFSIEWSQFFFYAFPPFCLIPRCVQKIIHDQASGILVIPRWTTHPFFHGCTQLADRHASYSESFSSESGSSNSEQSPSTSSTIGPVGMQIIGQSLQHSGISPDIVEVIMQSWRDSTRKQYKVYINKWLQFCCEGPHDPLHPSVRSLLSFLHSLFQKGLSYSTLNTARSAVSSIDINVSDV